MAPTWLVDVFVPTLGVIICNIMWISPYQQVSKARKSKELGNLNAIPFVVTVS